MVLCDDYVSIEQVLLLFLFVFKCRFYATHLHADRPTLISPNISFPALFHQDHQPLTSNAIQSAILPIGQ